MHHIVGWSCDLLTLSACFENVFVEKYYA
jgi:hypothetical protein